MFGHWMDPVEQPSLVEVKDQHLDLVLVQIVATAVARAVVTDLLDFAVLCSWHPLS